MSGEELYKYVMAYGINLNKFDSGLRTYVGRLKKDINLLQFLEKDVGRGWKLKEP